MTQELPFGWIGETRRTALHALLETLVDEWARDWWVGAQDSVISVQWDEKDGGHDKRNMPWLSVGNAGTLAIQAGGKEPDAIGRFLAGANTDTDIELAERVGEDAVSDLAMRIQRRAGENQPAQMRRDRAPAGVLYMRFGAFRAIAAIGRLQLSLAFDRIMADRLAPPSANARNTALLSRQQAVQQAPLKVQAIMNFGSVDLAHLSDLSVGEVLVGDRGLNEPLQIHVQGHGAVVAGYLRRQGEQRAVVLDGHYQQER